MVASFKKKLFPALFLNTGVILIDLCSLSGFFTLTFFDSGISVPSADIHQQQALHSP